MGETIVQLGLVVMLCWLFYKLGQNKAWNQISENYIAIHKNCVVGSFWVKKHNNYRKEKTNYVKQKNKKIIAKRYGKKTSK